MENSPPKTELLATGTSTVHFAMSFNESYLLPALITIMSLSRHLQKNVRPVLHLVNHNLTDDAVAKIRSYIETHVFEVGKTELRDICKTDHFPVEAAAPLMLADILPPEINRVVFLDADLLITDDIAPLAKTSLDGHILGAVVDTAIPQLGSPRGIKDIDELGLDPQAPYFNAGVLVMDLDAWRNAKAMPKILSYLSSPNRTVDFFHQEAMNAALSGSWKLLEDRWNAIGSLHGRNFGPAKNTRPDVPAIIHFAGRMKPWKFDVQSPFLNEYQNYVQLVLDTHPTLKNADRQTANERILSLYDRHLRQFLYPLEHQLWKHRIL